MELNFPATIPDEYLGEYFWHNSANIIPEGVIISEPQVKVGFISVLAFNSADNSIGSFLLCNVGININNLWYVDYIYVDRDFTVTGSSKNGLVFDCSFEKGLNIRYYTPLSKGKYTTQKPSDEVFEWRYEEFSCE